MRLQGRITTWKDERGFGFITPDMAGEPVFLHIKAFSKRDRRPFGNEVVTFDVTKDGKGRLQARDVAYVDERREPPAGPRRGPWWLAGGFLILVALFGLTAKLPLAVLWAYLGASLITYAAYGLDKSAARQGRWRTRESTLHLMALVGGWPGALVAQHTLRHKSRKAEFRVLFWLSVLLNVGLFGYLLTAAGRHFLQGLIGAA